MFGSFKSSMLERSQSNLTGSQRIVILHGEPLLVLLPVPDFSMPFNVICFVCTAIALFYGPANSLTTKIMIPVTDEDAIQDTGLIRRLISRISGKIRSKWRKPKEE